MPSRSQRPRFLKLTRAKPTVALQNNASSMLASTDVFILSGPNAQGPANARTATASDATRSARKFFIAPHKDTQTLILKSTLLLSTESKIPHQNREKANRRRNLVLRPGYDSQPH